MEEGEEMRGREKKVGRKSIGGSGMSYYPLQGGEQGRKEKKG